jgi:manganese-dependent inorganic pyrophosphatase
MDEIYVFGHKNPDSDTICSALAYAELKKALGEPALAVRLGELTSETKFILKYFMAAQPPLLETIKTQVSDLVCAEPLCAAPEASVRSVWMQMKQRGVKSLAVTDAEGRLVGMATLSDITRNYMDLSDDMLLAKSSTPFSNIIETLSAQIVLGRPDGRMARGRVLVSAQHHTRAKRYMGRGDIVIANIGENIREAIRAGADMVICTCGLKPDGANIACAEEDGCIIVSTAYDTFTAAMLIRQSVPVGSVMTRDTIVTVRRDEFIDDVRERMLKTRFRSYPVVDEENKAVGMLSRYHLLSRRRKRAILVDHNERSQTADGIEEAEIVEIIDHHRLGDIQTNNPILVKNEPVGSTAAIIASLYTQIGVVIPQGIAGLLLSAIITDTLNFKSPTCTPQDEQAARMLSEIADVDIGDLARKIFGAGSILRSKTPDEIIESDLKEYMVGKTKVGIAQVYSIDSESLSDMREALLERMEYCCDRNGFGLLMLLVTDLNRGGSDVLFVGSRKDIFLKAYPQEDPGAPVFLPDVLSRKKQVVPLIMSVENEI